MARPTTTQALTPSILDRLIDHEPHRQVEAPASRSQVIRELRESVRRDLEILLNTRIPCVADPKEWVADKSSVINYGIPDHSGLNLNSDEDRESFAKLIQKIILHYESRFKLVHIKVLSNDEDYDRTFRFRIDAILKVEPAVKAIVFDSSLEKVSRKFTVRDVESG